MLTVKKNLRHGENTIVSVRFTRNGEHLISASFDGTVVLWDVQTRKRVWDVDLDAGTKTKESHTISEILDMDVSPDGATIAVAYDRSHVVGNTVQGKSEYRIGLLDSRDGRELRALTGHTTLIGTLAFSPDGRFVASASSDLTARLWSIEQGQVVWSIKLRGPGKRVVFSPDGKQLAIGMLSASPWQPVVEVHDVQTGNLKQEYLQGRRNVSDIAFSQNGQLLAVASHDDQGSQVELWNLKARTRERSYIYAKSDTSAIAFSPSGRVLAVGGSKGDGGDVIIRPLRLRSRASIYRTAAAVTSISFSPDGSVLAVSTEKGEISLLEP